jgi:sarcosine oxidase subunit beta
VSDRPDADADVVVVGAGIVGAAVAFHAARDGARVTVVDAADGAAGATVMSTGMVRVHQPDMELARLSHLGWEGFQRWEEVVGGPSPLVTTGCVHEVVTGGERAEAEVAELSSWGVPCRVVDATELRSLFPEVHWRDGTVAVHEPDSGYADGAACRRQYLARVAELGGSVRTGVRVRALALDDDGRAVAGVRTGDGDGDRIEARRVVVATGAWSAVDGLLPPPLPVRTRLILWQQLTGGRRALPCYVHEGPEQLYFRPEPGGGLRFGVGCDDWDVDPSAVTAGAHDELLAKGRARVAQLVGTDAVDGRAATVLAAADGYTPDGRPIVDAWPGVDGLYVALGFSGGGFKMAPAVGALLASLVTSGERSDVLAPYALERAATS